MERVSTLAQAEKETQHFTQVNNLFTRYAPAWPYLLTPKGDAAMEQNRPKQTDQQATNAALAALAAAGNAFALGQLWEVNKGFVRRQLLIQFFHTHSSPAVSSVGISDSSRCRIASTI